MDTTGQKSIKLRRGKAKKGDVAVFQCGRNILRRKIIKKEEGKFTTVILDSITTFACGMIYCKIFL